MAAALQYKIAFFPLQELCTLKIFFIFDIPFLSGMEEAKTIYYSLCCELLEHNKNEWSSKKLLIAKFKLLELYSKLKAMLDLHWDMTKKATSSDG